MQKAIFLDRDGTINEDIGHLFSEDKIVFIPGSLDALRMLQEDYLLFIITNQPGVEQGAFTEEQCLKFSKRYNEILRSEGVIIRETFYCPHKKESACGCIKPNTFFIDKILANHPLEVGSSYVIGDHPHDIVLGKNAGAKTVYLLTGHGRQHMEELQSVNPDLIEADLYAAAVKITGKEKTETTPPARSTP